MTLIAAFRCYEGVVLCADDQETVDDVFRVRVDKLEPAPVRNYEVAAAGTGNVSELIDGFIDTLWQAVDSWPQALTQRQIQASARRVLVDYFQNEVKHHPAKRAEKYLQFVICLRDQSTRNVFLFETANTVLREVRSSVLMGFWPSIYQHEVDRLYDPSQHAGQVVVLGIHIFDMARKMTNVIGENVKIVVATEHGMKSELDADVKNLQDRFEQFDRLISELVTTLPNLGSTMPGL